ncbi:ATP phosphoribosyltransferase (ATP-PRTase) (ATP-PRT) [Rhodotorula kratochvilovae]
MLDLLSESLAGRALFAIPKKGRLYEKCLQLLAGADVQFTRSHRLDVCLVRNHNMALVFLPAADIPRFVGEGNVHFGITGQDMVAEADAAELVTEVLPLEFGKCKLQVQVPVSGDIKTVQDLVGRKVVTSFEVLAGRYFGALDEKSGKEVKTKIEYIGGSVEAACALGLADGIESGETMRAAGLHAIETILSSQAVLIRSNKPADSHDALITRITSRIAGVVAAGKYVLCNYNIPRKVVSEATKITPGRQAPTVSPLDDPEWVAVSSMVLKAQIAEAMDRLQEIGASDILVIGLQNCRV